MSENPQPDGKAGPLGWAISVVLLGVCIAGGYLNIKEKLDEKEKRRESGI